VVFIWDGSVRSPTLSDGAVFRSQGGYLMLLNVFRVEMLRNLGDTLCGCVCDAIKGSSSRGIVRTCAGKMP